MPISCGLSRGVVSCEVWNVEMGDALSVPFTVGVVEMAPYTTTGPLKVGRAIG